MIIDPAELPAFLALSNCVAARTGLTFAPYRRAEVAARVQCAMRRCQIDDTRQYLEHVRRDADVLDVLLLELTVGETYFFRDRAQFDLLRDEILPGVAREHDGTLRIWSAGCATGEEPYSIAVLLAKLGLADRARVCATDLCRGRLTQAARARYGAWSLRETPDEIRRAYFTPAGHLVELRPEIRGHVEFRAQNLVDADDPCPWQHEADLVVCRNVLIYLRPELIQPVARRLIEALRPGGWLLLGASDPFIGDVVTCDVVTTPAGLVYRRPAAAAPDAHASATLPRARAAAPRDDVAAASTDASVDAAARVRALIRRGDLATAGRACTSALERYGADPVLWYLEAFLLGASEHHAASAAAARRVLFLDRGSPLGHLALAGARLALGDDGGACAAFRRAERLLAALPASAPVPGIHADTAGELLRGVRLWLAVRG